MPTGILEKGHTFADGDTVHGADLNELVDLGNVLPGFIDSKTDVVPGVNDHVLVLQGTGPGTLIKSKLSELPAQVSSVALAMPTTEFAVTGSPVTTTGTLTAAWKPQAGNVFLAGTGGSAAFRTLTSGDLALPTASVGALNIDWALGNLFYRLLVSVVTFTFSNLRDGQTIKVMCQQDSFGSRVVNWPHGMGWKGAAFPTQSMIPFAVDIYEFTCYGGTVVFAQGDMNYRVID